MNNDLRPITTLPPFKRMCMTIGELPTSYLETMTYYEMLVWFTKYMQDTIIPTINNNGLAIDELQDKYIELKSYVDNYFDNLDVQEEINNKLDEMTESGELTNLIKNYVDPLQNSFEAQITERQNLFESDITNQQVEFQSSVNSQINLIDNKVNSATSGSPLVASSTSEMTETDRIYVNTTDGYWYYYDGTAWTQGDVYQSSGIADNSITSIMLQNQSITPRKIKEVNDVAWFNPFRFCEEFYTDKIYSGGNLVDYQGVTSTQLVPITPSSTLLVNQILQSPARIVLYNANKEYINQLGFTNIQSININTRYIGVSVPTENIDEIYKITQSLGVKSVNIPWINIEKDQIIEDEKTTLKGIVFGDSLWSNCRGTLNYPNSPFHPEESGQECYGYQQYLENAILPNYNIEITNYAQGGWGTVQWYRETSSPYCVQNLTENFMNQFDFCILSFGTNDATSGEQLGTIGTSSDNTTNYNNLTFIGAYRHCIDILLSLNPNLKIILWTPIPKILNVGSDNYYGIDTPNINGVTMTQFVNAIKEIGHLYSFPVVDLFNNVEINKFNIENWTFEGVHLTNPGYEYIQNYFVNETIKYLDNNQKNI